ncbi:MAG TPA: hypothetical protein VK163_07805 [Opitutaceae bacterium]|nr:hypothetical protein [Opitutaceae bacterium]
MQTRSLAAASGALLALGVSLFALRPVLAGPAAISARDVCCAEGTPSMAPFSGDNSARPPTPVGAARTVPLATTVDTLSPELRADLALTIGDAGQRAAALAEALSAWAATDAGSALVWLERHPHEDHALLAQAIGEGLAADPAGATFALTYLEQDRERGALLAGALVRSLAARGQSAAAVRLARVSPEGWSHEWATVAFTNLAYEDAASALETLSAVLDLSLRPTIAAAIISGWSERDPAELAHNADVFARPEERAVALTTALAKWQERAPDAARSFADAAATPGRS